MVKPRVFLISGMGADERLFKHLDLSGFEVIPVHWFEPEPNDTLSDYAGKVIQQFGIQVNDNVIGVSLGGMITVEIAKQVQLNHAILISSIKTVDEAPAYYSFFRGIGVHKWLSGQTILNMGFLFKPIMGKLAGGPEGHLFYLMLKNTSPTFLKWSIGASLKWHNTIVPSSVSHIIGTADKVFNYKKIKDPIIVQGGDHMMVFNRAKEISVILKGILSK